MARLSRAISASPPLPVRRRPSKCATAIWCVWTAIRAAFSSSNGGPPMLDIWNLLGVRLLDVLLGWLLLLPRSVAVVVVALATAALLTLIRKWTTNQDRLRRAAADMRRLKELKHAATQVHDKDALARLKITKGRISVLKLKAEGWPVLAVLLPV